MKKKTMWVIESGLNIREIVAIVDEETDKIECYAYKDEYDDPETKQEWMRTYDDEQYFDTEGQAVDARNQFVREMQDMMPRVAKFIARMECIDENSKVFPHKKEDYLDCYADSNKNNADYYRGRYWEEQETCKRLARAMRTGLLNINAETVRIDDVVRIEWGVYPDSDKNGDEIKIDTATLVLKSGRELRTRKKMEYRLVDLIFGGNDSGRIFNVSRLRD